jgi:hypothetical protein
MSDYVSSNYVTTTRAPEGCSSRLYHIEPGCEYGTTDDDGAHWYRIQTSYWFGDWIETQDRGLWKTHGGRHRAIYIVRGELMTIIKLMWL